jgi:GTP diphosphokinase / guanosine-3',5'-bis(diphosphate) 3'-diphosphatase
MLAALGYGELGLTQVLNRLKPEPAAPALPPEQYDERLKKNNTSKNSVLVDGSDSLLLALAKCCNPLPGEPIQGTVSRGKGITVHNSTCQNLAQIKPERWVEVAWAQKTVTTFYPVEIEIELIDRVGLLKDITAKLADSKTNIRAARVKTSRDKVAVMNLVVDVADIDHLNRVLSTVTRMADVVRAYRVIKQRR